MVRKSSLALLIAASLAPLSAYALGLGDLHLKSALNQELKADIDLLSVKSGELDTVKVELASTEAFDKAGLDRSFLLTQLRFRPVRRPDGSAVVEVTSRGPIPEPFLNFLVEVNWPNGRLLREYTVLLDPPATVDRRPPAVAAPAAGTRSGPAARGAAGGGAPAGRVAMPGEYGPTQANDTLWEIAAGLRPSGVSIQQMMIALQRANPDAFYRGNINYLKQGQILRVPAREDIAALSGAEARAAFLEQTARWEADRVEREGPSTEVVEAPPEEVVEAGAPASAAAQPEAPSGELRIAAAPSAGGEAGAGEGGAATSNVEELRDRLALAREANESMRQESVNLESRIQDLESQLEDMERLLTLKDDQLAQLQATLGAEPEQPPLEAEEASMAEAGGEPMPGEEAMEGEEAMAGEEAQTMAPGGEAGAGVSTMPAESEGAAMEPPMGPSGPEEGMEAESRGPESALPSGESEGSMTAGEGPGAPMKMAEESASEPGEGMEEPTPPPMEEEPAAGAESREAGGAPWSNPVFWAIGAVALVVLGGLGVAATRRRKETADEADESILVDNAEVSAQRSEGFAMSGESDSQTDETSFLSDFS
ncbi:MAG: FimV/HubP family polar landmark protein, partial [Chromatiales bacterium]